MPVEQIDHIPFTRGGIEYILHMGIDAEGNSVDYIDQVTPDAKGNLLRYYPAETHIYRDKVNKRGGMYKIQTIYFCGVRGADDEIIEGSDKKVDFETGKLDITYFVAGLGRPIMASGNNGLVRAKFGFNTMPIFSPTGQLITYTPEQEAEPPTNDYWLQTNPHLFVIPPPPTEPE